MGDYDTHGGANGEPNRSTGDGETGDRLDRVFDALSDSRRRHALYWLGTRSKRVAIDELAAAVAERDPSIDGGARGVAAVRRSLHHRHLPRLDEAGFVAFDPERGEVEPADDFGALEPYFAVAAAEERHASRSPAAGDGVRAVERAAATNEPSLPGIDAVYFDSANGRRAATCKFANGSQLRVRRSDDETLVAEVFRAREPLTVWRDWTIESREPVPVHLVALLANCYAGRADARERARELADVPGDAVSHLTAALTDERRV